MDRADFHTALHRWSPAPMVTAFLVAPLAFGAARLSWLLAPPWVARSADMSLWLLLSGLAVLACLFQKSLDHPESRRLGPPLAAAVLFATAVTCLFLFATPLIQGSSGLIPYAQELKPVIFLLFALAWTATFGLPTRTDIQRLAAGLGALVVCDAALALLRQTPERFLGSPDVLATLLLIGLCTDLKPAHHEPDHSSPAWRTWIMLGLLATLSRTGLFTAAWIYAFFGRGSAWKRLPYVTLCAVTVGGSFLLDAHLGLGGVRYVEYWIWLECFQLLAEPGRMYAGFPLGEALPIVPSLSFMGLWQMLFPTSPLDGLYIQQIPSFWVRTVMAWGVIPPLTLAATLFGLLMRTPTRFGAGLTAVIIAQGISTDLLFSPGPAIALLLALMLAFRTGNK